MKFSAARFFRKLVFTFFLIALSSPARAATYTWNNTGTDFNATSSWNGGIVPTVGDSAVFDVAATTNPQLSVPTTISGINFSQALASGYTLSGATLTVMSTSPNSGSAAVINSATSGTNTISANLNFGAAAGANQYILGTGGAFTVFSGTISSSNSINLFFQNNNMNYALSSANTFTGTATQSARSNFYLGNKDALGASVLNLASDTGSIQATTTLTGANKITNDIIFTRVTTTNETIGNGGAIEFGGNVNLGGVQRTITNSNLAGTAFSGVISNDGGNGIIFAGAGTTSLTALNTYTGPTTLIGTGGLAVTTLGNAGSSSSLGTSGTVNVGNTTTTSAIRYIGAGETSNKVINLNGSTGGAIIDTTGASGALVLTSNIGATAAGTKVLTLTGDTNGNTISGNIANGSGLVGLTKTGTGEWRLTGTNSYTGITALLNGTLTLDFSAANAPVSNIINSSGTLALGANSVSVAGSATLNVIGNAGASNVQTFAPGTTLNYGPGAFHINLTPGSGGSLTVNTGAMPAHPSGFTLDFGLQSGATVNVGTTGTSANGLLATMATINGTDFATKDGSNNVVTFTNYTNNTATTLNTANNQVVDMTAGDTTLSGPGTTTVSGLRFNTAGATTITLGANRHLAIGGGQAAGPILVTSAVGANTTTITGGLLAGISSRDLIVLQNNTAGSLQIDSVITSLNANSLAFTKSGLGEVLLTASNAYNSNTFINEGKVTVTSDVVAGNTQTLTTTVGSGTLTGVDTTGLFVGQRVYSLNTGTATSGQFIASISGNTVVLGGTATASGSTDVTFANAGGLGFMTGSNAVQVGAAATLQIGNGGTTGNLVSGQGILNNGTVALDRSNAFTFSNTITGSGSVVQAGSGVTTLEGVQGYTGATVVNAGTLLINGTALSSAATVNSGGALGGTGTVGSITVNAGGAITPGNSIGQLNTNNGSLTWNGQTSGAFGQMKFELDTLSSSSDLLNLGTGILDQGTGLVFAFDFLGTGAEGFTYTLITFASTDFTVDDFSYSNLASGLTGSFIQNADNLQFVVIPEPSTVALAGLGLALLLSRSRRRDI